MLLKVSSQAGRVVTRSLRPPQCSFAFSSVDESKERINVVAGRAEQARGAMKQYFNNANESLSQSQNGLWSKLRKDFRNKQPPGASESEAAAIRSAMPFAPHQRRVSFNRRFPRTTRKRDDAAGGFDEQINDYHDFDPRKEQIDISSLDELDALMAHAFENSYHTSNNSVMHWIHKPQRESTPQIRCISQLAMSVQPDIRGLSADDVAYATAATSWTVLSKNKYVSERERDLLCNTMAAVEAYCLDDSNQSALLGIGADDIFDDDFKLGHHSIIMESEDSSAAAVGIYEAVVQDRGEWTDDAVVDEDQF